MARRSREVNIFHFSFLDILFNTIGAITFIFMIYAVMTNNLVEERNVARIELESQQKQIKENQGQLSKMKEEASDMKENLEKIQKKITDAEDKLKRAKTDIRKQKIKLKKKDKTISQLKKKVKTLKRGTGLDIDLDSTLMSEWGEAGGSQATRIEGQMIGNNVEWLIVTTKGTEFNVSGFLSNLIPSQSVDRMMRYYDPKNQAIKYLTGEDSSTIAALKERLNVSEEGIAPGLKSLRDQYYPPLMDGQEKVETDTNVDGVVDHTYYDLDGNGEADKLTVDWDNDGQVDEIFLAYDGKEQKWGTKLVDVDGDGNIDTAFMDKDFSNSRYEYKLVDFNPKTGKSRIKYEDKDGDGIFDSKQMDLDMSDDDWEEIYMAFDPQARRWTNISKDTNNDGYPDIILKDTNLANDSFEEKTVDTDFDGLFDSKWIDLEPGDSDWEAWYVQQDENTGNWKEAFFDSNGDGKWDGHTINSDLKDEVMEILLQDNDGDGKFETKLVLDPATGDYNEEKSK